MFLIPKNLSFPWGIGLLVVFWGNVLLSQNTTVYCLPGQGADCRLFDSLSLGPAYKIVCLEYGTPEKGFEMADFAHALAVQIDTTAPFVLLGVSLGGMICCEMTEFLHAEKTIIISSASTSQTLPFRYRFQKIIPLYRIVPGWLVLIGAKCLQPIVEPDRNKHKAVFKSMLGQKSPLYMKRTVRMIMRWERHSNSHKIYHIHGTNDHTLPYRKVRKPDYTVSGGSHMMTLTRGAEVSALVRVILGN